MISHDIILKGIFLLNIAIVCIRIAISTFRLHGLLLQPQIPPQPIESHHSLDSHHRIEIHHRFRSHNSIESHQDIESQQSPRSRWSTIFFVSEQGRWLMCDLNDLICRNVEKLVHRIHRAGVSIEQDKKMELGDRLCELTKRFIVGFVLALLIRFCYKLHEVLKKSTPASISLTSFYRSWKSVLPSDPRTQNSLVCTQMLPVWGQLCRFNG